MTSREFFEAVRSDLASLESLKRRCDVAENACQPHGGAAGSSHGGCADSTARYDALIELREEVARAEARAQREADSAAAVLYGESGRGGYARARSATDADIVFGRYLMLMPWSEVAAAVSAPDGPSPERWCRMRAARAFRSMDELGMAALADS